MFQTGPQERDLFTDINDGAFSKEKKKKDLKSKVGTAWSAPLYDTHKTPNTVRKYL